jgi:hypothetical protein
VKIFWTASLIMCMSSPAFSEDVSSLADRWTADLQDVTDKLIGEARRFEGISGKIPLPGGRELGVDDLLNEDPKALARKMGETYSSIVDNLAEARSDIDVEEFRNSIMSSFSGSDADIVPEISNDPHVIASMIDTNLRDLVRVAKETPGDDYGIASRLRYIASEMQRQADILDSSE